MKLGEIAKALNATLHDGEPDREITGVAGIEEAVSGQITFVANPKRKRGRNWRYDITVR